jgi:hypothetical protein
MPNSSDSQDQSSEARELEIVSEGTTPSALEAIERASIDVQIATAHKFPRSMALFKTRALDMVSLDQETAASCIYRRPVGKNRDGSDKIAEGMSVRMAEIVGASYGNLRVVSMVTEQTPQFVKCRAVAHDLESNYMAASEVIESTIDRNGNPYSPRQRIVVAKAALSKAHRDATFKVVPRALCKAVMAKAIEVEAGGRTLEDRRASAYDWIKSLKIDEKRVWGALGIKGLADVGADQLVVLLGLRTAINDKEATIDEAFPSEGEDDGKPEVEGRPKRERRPTGAAAAAEASKPKTEAPPAAPADPAPAAPAPAPEPEKPKVTLAPTAQAPAAPAIVKAMKADQELSFKGCKIVNVEVDLIALTADDQKGQPSVIAKITGPFEGEVYHIGGATVVDISDPAAPKLEAAPVWKADGPVNIVLKGVKTTGGAVLPMVEEIIIDAAATVARRIRTL